jgi:RNA polymerase sigma-70 factor (ECF subfamily)
MSDDKTSHLQALLDRLNHDDPAARDELIARAADRLRRLARRMLDDFRRVRRWEGSDDVLQNALLRLWRALQAVRPQSVREFFRLAAVQVRRELLDMARHYHGPEGAGAHHASVGGSAPLADADHPMETSEEPSRLARWGEFHDAVEALPDEEREAVDLLWYQELTQDEAAALLNTSASTVRRRWRSALLKLHEVLHGELPEVGGRD